MYQQICFKSYYDVVKNKFYLSSEKYSGELDKKYLIEDCYSIEILKRTNGGYYAIEEERIKRHANELGVEPTDLHVNPGNDLCVAPVNTQHFKENHKNKTTFVSNLLIPFLYSHSFFECHNERPWEDYSHGEIGYMEAYVREVSLDSKEKTLNTIYVLKDSGISIKRLRDPEFTHKVSLESEEAARGIEKIISDIDKFSLRKFIR